MKELIKVALDEAKVLLDKQTPLLKKETVTVDLFLEDVTPHNILQFMKDRGIPDDAYFGTTYHECSISDYVQPALCYEVDVPTTEKEKREFRVRRFTTIAFKRVYDILTSNGYTRVGYDTYLLKEFKDTTLYDMYVTGDFDRIVRYYSLPFRKI